MINLIRPRPVYEKTLGRQALWLSRADAIMLIESLTAPAQINIKLKDAAGRYERKIQ